MRAIRVHELGPPEVMRLEDLAAPVPGPGEVTVRVRAAGVNPVDTYVRSGMGTQPALPYTPGSDAAGTVEAVGTGVLWPAVGQRVYVYGSVSGTYAEPALASRWAEVSTGRVSWQDRLLRVGVPAAGPRSTPGGRGWLWRRLERRRRR